MYEIAFQVIHIYKFLVLKKWKALRKLSAFLDLDFGFTENASLVEDGGVGGKID